MYCSCAKLCIKSSYQITRYELDMLKSGTAESNLLAIANFVEKFKYQFYGI